MDSPGWRPPGTFPELAPEMEQARSAANDGAEVVCVTIVKDKNEAEAAVAAKRGFF